MHGMQLLCVRCGAGFGNIFAERLYGCLYRRLHIFKLYNLKFNYYLDL